MPADGFNKSRLYLLGKGKHKEVERRWQNVQM
nr:MAG TPA: hypothetical protein [Caudoviricetes sp.]DAR92530.1 MAG TPA: hypothetical protein [Bacteriophage sp.]